MAQRNHDIHIIQPLPLTPPAPFDLILGRERVLLSRAPRKETNQNFSICRPRYLHLPRKPVNNAVRFGKIGAQCIREMDFKPDVIICDYAWPAARVIEYLDGDEIPVVIHGRGSDVTAISRYPFLRKELQRNLSLAGNWCAVSRDLVDRLDKLGEIWNRGMLTPNGVDTSLFHPGDQRTARQNLNISSESPLVLVVGQLIHRKRPLLALESFLQGAPQDAQLVFIGRGPLKETLEKRILEENISHRVFIVDEMFQSEIAQWYRAASVLLITSSREGRPNVILEALASGLPVVATRTGGSAELLKGMPEFLASVGNEKEIARSLDLALSRPPTQNVCVEQIAHLTWKNACQYLEDALHAAMDRHNQPMLKRAVLNSRDSIFRFDESHLPAELSRADRI